jgi:hypothetical protein
VDYSHITLDIGMAIKKALMMIPLSDRVPRRASGPSRTWVDDGGGLQYFSWIDVWALGFSQRREFIGGRAMSEGT